MSEPPPTAAIPIPSGKGSWRDMFLALRERAFRIFTICQLCSTTGIWMQRMTQDWLVLQLTGDVALVGLLALFQFGPALLFGLWGGVIVDRRITRNILLAAQTGIVSISTILAVLSFMGWITTTAVFACAVVLGFLSVVEQPGRLVFINELVGPGRLANAISMHQSTFQLGSMLGAVLGAAMIPLGASWAFLGTALLTGVWLAGLLLIRPRALYPRFRAEPAKGQITEALRYVRRKPAIFWTILLLVFLCVTGTSWPVLLLAFADRVFQTGGEGYGVYNAVLAAGCITGGLIALRWSTVTVRAVYAFAAAMLVLKIVSAWMPNTYAFAGLVYLASVSMMLMWTAANPLLQYSSNPAIRGRVMSLYLLITAGGPALGAPLLGWIVEHLDARLAMTISGILPLIALGVLTLLQLRRRTLRGEG